MASTDGSERIGGAEVVGRGPGVSSHGGTALERRTAQTAATDPDQLAEQIERTRMELAETFDAIAEKVSPKRVARRTSQRVGETVREKAAVAGEAVKAGAAQVRTSAAGAVETVRDKVGSPTSDLPAYGGSVALEPAAPATATTPGLDLPPTEPVAVPSLATGDPLSVGTAPTQVTTPTPSSGAHAAGGVTTYASPPLLRKEYVAGGAGAVLVLAGLLLRRRRG